MWLEPRLTVRITGLRTVKGDSNVERLLLSFKTQVARRGSPALSIQYIYIGVEE